MKMKKCLVLLLSLLLLFTVSHAEDAVTSATLAIDHLPEAGTQESTILVVYFSPDDTVRAAAYTIAAAVQAELFEIVPVQPYTEADLDYFDNFSRAIKESHDKDARPEIAELPADLSRYETIYLGYPIWGGRAPKILYTFLESVDLAGKTVIPFCTANSSNIGSSATELHKAADDAAEWLPGGRIKKGSTAEDIVAWLQELETP